MSLLEAHQGHGAALAADGIPLHYGDLRAEYRAAFNAAVLMDRSHEGRFVVSGRDRLDLMHRISTNDLLSLREGEGRATIFTNANARILDRALVYNLGERALVLAEPGRGAALRAYLQRNIFFNDDARIEDLNDSRRQFVVHGANADSIGGQITPGLAAMHAAEVQFAGVTVIATRDKPLSGGHWRLILPADAAPDIWSALLQIGADRGLIPAGSLTYNTLRIHAGRPGVERELTGDYLPLEVGLWDEISFTKGCYTGQEIIARMESRGKLAKIMVTLALEAPIEAPAPIDVDGRTAGTLTSSVETPDEECIGIGVLRLSAAKPGTEVTINGVTARIVALAGVPPPYLDESVGS